MKQTSLLYLISIILVTVSCVQTPAPTYPKRINYFFNVNNVGDTLSAGQDSISITEFKLLAEKFNLLVAGNETKLQSQVDALIMGYREANGSDDELVIATDLGYKDFTNFDGLELFIAPPTEGDNISDVDFFGDNTNYSTVFKGEYNGKNFTYRSTVAFQKDFQFDTVELTDTKNTIATRFLLDFKDIIIDKSTGKILDPENADNKSKIDSLIKNTMRLEAFATQRTY